jgi:hypothetical protein
VLADTPQHFAAATSIQHQHSSCSVQALAPAPGELPSATPSSQQIHTQHAGRWPPRPRGSRRGFGHIWHRCALRAFLPLRRLLLTSVRSAQVTTRGGCRTERLTALRRELRALPRQVSFQRNHHASSPLHNCSCTQAIAVVRPLAQRSRLRCGTISRASSSASLSCSCTQADTPCRWSLLEDSSPAFLGSCGRLLPGYLHHSAKGECRQSIITSSFDSLSFAGG